MYFTVFYIFSRVQGVFFINEVNTFSTLVWHILVKEDFYLKITPHRVVSKCLRNTGPSEYVRYSVFAQYFSLIVQNLFMSIILYNIWLGMSF